MVAPAAPEPVNAPHPEPRPVWDSVDGRFKAQALDWVDCDEPTIEVLARHGRHWQPVSGEEAWQCLVALLLCWDRMQRGEAR